MSEHATGKWNADSEGREGFALNVELESKKWKHMAIFRSNMDGSSAVTENEAEANCRFVAKACNSFGPLLAALQRLTACPDVSLCEVEQETSDALDEARAAIAQAIGEE